MKTIDQVLNEKIKGLFFGPRVILPFVADILKVVIDDDIVTDFSPLSEIAYYEKQDDFTEIYFFEHKDILKDVSKYEVIKMIVVEEGKDMFDFKNHRKIALNPLEKHQIEISELDDELIFIE